MLWCFPHGDFFVVVVLLISSSLLDSSVAKESPLVYLLFSLLKRGTGGKQLAVLLVLGLPWDQVNVLHSSPMVLCFGFVPKTVLCVAVWCLVAIRVKPQQ